MKAEPRIPERHLAQAVLLAHLVDGVRVRGHRRDPELRMRISPVVAQILRQRHVITRRDVLPGLVSLDPANLRRRALHVTPDTSKGPPPVQLRQVSSFVAAYKAGTICGKDRLRRALRPEAGEVVREQRCHMLAN